MRIIAIASMLVFSAVTATQVVAQDRIDGPRGRSEMPDRMDGRARDGADTRASANDGRNAVADSMSDLDSRLSNIESALRLSGDQQRLWGPVQDAARGVVRQRAEAQQARVERNRARREARQARRNAEPRNLPEEFRTRADGAAAEAEAYRKLADATSALSQSLDDRQRRRLGALVPAMARAGRPNAGKADRVQRPVRGRNRPADNDNDDDNDMDDDDDAPPARRAR